MSLSFTLNEMKRDARNILDSVPPTNMIDAQTWIMSANNRILELISEIEKYKRKLRKH